VPKKTDDDIRPSALLSRGPSFERAAWLAKMLRAADQKELADPTEDDIAEMRMALGDDRTFAALPDDKKALLFLAMLTIRERLKIYREWVKFEEEPAGPLLSPLASLAAAIPNSHGLFSVAAAEMSEVRGISIPEAWRNINQFANTAEFFRKIFQRIAAKPKVFDKRTVRSRRQRHEAAMIGDSLKIIGVNVRMTGPNDRGRAGDDGLRLAIRIVRYTSGEKIELDAFRGRLARARALRTIHG
jgi:hypothetical protein